MIAELRDGSHSPKPGNRHWKFMSKASRGRYKLEQSKEKKALWIQGFCIVLSLSLSSYGNQPFLPQNSSQVHQPQHCLLKTAQWRQLLIFGWRNWVEIICLKSQTELLTKAKTGQSIPDLLLNPQAKHHSSHPLNSFIFSLSISLAKKHGKEINKNIFSQHPESLFSRKE